MDAAPTSSHRSRLTSPLRLILLSVFLLIPTIGQAQVSAPAGMRGGVLVPSGHTLPRGAVALGVYGALSREYPTNRAVEVTALTWGISDVFQLSVAGAFSIQANGSTFTSFTASTKGYAVGPIALTARLPGPADRPFQLAATAFVTPGIGSEPMIGHHHPWARDSFDLGFALAQSWQTGTLQIRLLEGYVITGDTAVNIPSHLLAGAGVTWMALPWIGLEGEFLSRIDTETPIVLPEDYLGGSGGAVAYFGPRLSFRGGVLAGLSKEPASGTSQAEMWGLYAHLSLTVGGALTETPPRERTPRERTPRERRRPQPPETVEPPETGIAADTDGDGVPDADDLEPDTPAGARVDAAGRALDADGDGIPDGIDLEPATPAGAIVDHTGRALDSDGDGVPDGIDLEPETPRGARVDESGKAIDADSDGVPDGIDLEPDTPAGVPTDAEGRGLYGMEAELITRGLLTLNTIYFDYNSATLKPESYQTLREVGLILIKYSELKIEIGGSYNLQLSRVRAEAVLNWLLDNTTELTLTQFTVKGYGESQPVTDNDTEAGRTLIRRVVFRVLNTDVLQRYRGIPPTLP